MTTITRLLVANRAEIASRVFRSCRALGIETVAVHSDPDAGLPYVAEADLAVRLPGSAPAGTYLDVAALLAAAHQSGADAVHPGYGFLSENAGFARAVIDAGLTWVGPDPASIDAMGSKIEAKRLMREAGVPTLEAPADPTEADLPLLVKASAGGGGRGMRVVRTLADLPTEIAAAEAEAASAFGDGTVFVEPYVEQGRHVEVQVVGSTVVGDRDCSVQRRHQKVVEEAPAPGLSDEVRAALHDAAHRAAAAIDYRGAGTVEFLLDPATDRFFFLEMNTRLQVEHPVTEEVHGVDLVALQLAAAEGAGPLGEVGAPQGHAIEVRLYAEDPAAGYQPQSGTLTTFEIPGAHGDEPGIRVESGFATGDVVSTFYDAMLAKVVAHGPDRRTAARRLVAVLRRTRIHGVVTNRDLLVSVLTDDDFLAGRLSTAFLDEHDLDPAGRRPGRVVAGLAATVLRAHRLAERRTVQRGVPLAFRTVPSQPQSMVWTDRPDDHRHEHDVAWVADRDGAIRFPTADLEVLGIDPQPDGGTVRVRWEDEVASLRVAFTGTDDRVAHVDSVDTHVRLELVPRFVDPADAVASGSLLAPMPGAVVSVLVEQGAEVAAGDPVLVLEAMKMQHTVKAPTAGTVTTIAVAPGAQVAAGEVLAVVEENA